MTTHANRFSSLEDTSSNTPKTTIKKNVFLKNNSPNNDINNPPNNNFRNSSSIFKSEKKEESENSPRRKNERWFGLENEILEENEMRNEKNMFKKNQHRNDRDKFGNYRKSFFKRYERPKTPPPKKFEFIDSDFPSLN
jgi:hypothetical protein